jgi:IS5 family transposase
LVKWRQLIKAEDVEKMLQEVLSTAMRNKALEAKDIGRVNVDTTVQEKAIAFPTDARLYEKARSAVVREAQRAAVKLRQSYERVGKKALYNQSRYARAQQIKRGDQRQSLLPLERARLT